MEEVFGISARMAALLSALPIPDPSITLKEGGLVVIDLSAAENCLLRPELLQICKDSIINHFTEEDFNYISALGGEPRMLQALASFFNTYFHPRIPVAPDQIATAAGVSYSFDALVQTICDEGDSILTPSPAWIGFGLLVTMHSKMNIITTETLDFKGALTMKVIPALRKAYSEAPEPKRIKALIISNPNNPVSRLYSPEVLVELMNFCHERGIHFISDEVHALSTFGRAVDSPSSGSTVESPSSFVSALSLESELRPSHKHIAWSATKDFGSSGIRTGCVVSQANMPLLAGLSVINYHQTSTLSSMYLTHLLESPKLPELVKLNATRLSEAYQFLTAGFERLGIQYMPASAGLTIFAKLAKDATTWEEEEAMIAKLFQYGVKVLPGKDYGGVDGEKGWARIQFSSPRDVMEEALKRIEACLNS